MMKYYNLLILFMIALKCGADEEPITVNDSAVENVTNSEIFSARSTEGKLANISSSSETNWSENTVINATDNNFVEVNKKEFDLPTPRKLAKQGTRMVKNIIASLMKGLTQLNKLDLKGDAGDNEEPSTVNYSSVEIVTKNEVSNASITEAPENLFDQWTQLPIISKSTLINATDAYAINPFKNKEFGKLPIPRKLPRHRTRLVTNITGSLMNGLAQLNKTNSEEDSEDDEKPTTVNYSTIENITNFEISNASTTEAPEHLFDKWTQLPNISKTTLINATDAYTINPFKSKEFGKLPILRKLPGHRTWVVTNITGNLMKALSQLNKQDSEEDTEDDEEPTTVKYSTVENLTNSGDAYAIIPFKNKEFGKLPIPRKLPRHRTRLVTNITGSLMNGLAQLNETDSEDDEVLEEPTIVNYSTIENITNSEISNASTTEASEPLSDKWTQLPIISKTTLINATDAYAINPFKNKEFGKLPIPRKLPRHRTRLVTNITGNLLKALAQLNKQDSEEDSEDNEEPTTVNYSTVENVTKSEISNPSTTEVPENHFDKWTLLPNINSPSETFGAESTRINLTATTVSPFKKKEFGKLPIPRRPQRGSWLMKNIAGSLMDGLAQLNETDSEDDEEIEEPTTANYATVENVSNSEIAHANTTEAPDHRFDEWIQLPNISSSSGSPATENTLTKVTDGNAVGPFTKKEFGKLPKLGTLPQQGARIMTNIVGSLLKGLSRETDSNKDEDGNIKKI